MNKLPKDKRDKIILIGMGTVVACAAIGFFVINAQRATLVNVRKEAEKSREQVTRGEAMVKAQATVQQQFDEASLALKTREAGMAVPNDMYFWFIQTLNGFRADHKVEIPQFGRETPSEVACLPKFPYQAATFTVRGTAYYQIGRAHV